MARKPDHGFEQRKREQARKARKEARRARKQERAGSSSTAPTAIGGEDPDLAGIVVGPQPKEQISQAEARRAVERALNPGKQQRDEGAAGRSSRLFVGNLDFEVEEQELRSLFTEAGFTVAEVAIVKDRDTGRPRGFAFVDIVGLTQAARAVTELDGVELAGRALRLNIADKPGRRR